MNKIIKLSFVDGGQRGYELGDEIVIKRRETIEKIEFVAPNTALYMPVRYDFGVYCIFTKEGHIIAVPATRYTAIWQDDGETLYF